MFLHLNFSCPSEIYDTSCSVWILPALAVLKKYWRVSMASILVRAKSLGTITANQARYLWTQMSRAGYRLRDLSNSMQISKSLICFENSYRFTYTNSVILQTICVKC